MALQNVAGEQARRPIRYLEAGHARGKVVLTVSIA
jgi:hypothetical protein